MTKQHGSAIRCLLSPDPCMRWWLQYVLGKGGVALMLIIVFMAVTSAGSSEFMAVGSLFTFDIYKVGTQPFCTRDTDSIPEHDSATATAGLMLRVMCKASLHAIQVQRCSAFVQFRAKNVCLGLQVHLLGSRSPAQGAAEILACRCSQIKARFCHVAWRPSQCSFHAQTYIRPKASSKELLMVTRITVACFGMLTGVVAIILFVVGPPDHSRPCMHACATEYETLEHHLHEHVTALLTVDTTA